MGTTGNPGRTIFQKHRSALMILSMISSLLCLSGCNNDGDPATTTSKIDSGTVRTAPTGTSENTEEADNSETPVFQPSTVTVLTEVPEAAALSTDLYADIPLSVTQISEMTYDGGYTVGIRFSAPVSPDQPLQSFVHVSGAESAWVLSEDGLFLYLLDATPKETYTIYVSKGLKARNGTELKQGKNAEVTLSDAPPAISFASDGNYLTTGLANGLPVSVQNVDEVNVSFFRVGENNDALRQMLIWKSSGNKEYVYRLESLNQFSEFVYEGRITLAPAPNRFQNVNLPLAQIEALKEPGVYIAVMSQPGQYSQTLSATWFSVSDIGLHLRKYKDRLGVFTRDVNTGQARAGVDLTLMSDRWNKDSETTEARSDQHGFASMPYKQSHRNVLIARSGDSTTLLNLDQANLDLSDFDLGARLFHDNELFLYSPRDLYRGGDKVVINALLRGPDGELLPDTLLRRILKQPDGQIIKNEIWRSRKTGFYEYSLTLPEDAQTGDWSLDVQLPDRRRVTYRFKVEDFMPERMKLTWNPENTSQIFAATGPLTLQVQGDYFYGAPAAGNNFEADISLMPEGHPFPQWSEFFFGDRENKNWSESIGSLTGTMDDEGRLSLTPENHWANVDIPLALRLTGSLYESGGRPVVRSHKAVIVPEGQMTGIRPLFKDNASANSMAGFELINTDSKGELVSNSNIQLNLINRTLEYHWRYDPQSGWHPVSQRRNVTELTLPLNVPTGTVQKVSVPVQWGEYILEAKDTLTGASSRFYFSAGSSWYWDSQTSSGRPDKVELAFDQENYRAGDIARLRITPPATGRSIILVESDELLYRTEADIPAEGAWVEIPVSPSWKRHDLYVSVVHLQPVDEETRITPTRAVGLIHLPLDRTERQLNLTIDTPEKWLPSETRKVKVRISDKHDRPVSKAWVTLAAVDVGILSITRFETPDPFGFFFAKRRFQVDIADMYGKLIDLNNNRSGSVRYGGDADLTRGGDMARSEVQIISLYSGLVDVVGGEAEIPITIPDFNGRLRLMALAYDDTRSGSTEQEVRVAAPVVAQLSMPRFVAAGDQSLVALDVTNLTGTTTTLTISLSANGPVRSESLLQQVTLDDQQRHTQTYPFSTTNAAGHIDFHAEIRDGEKVLSDKHWGLNSRQPYPAQTFSLASSLDQEQSLALGPDKLSQWSPDTLKASLSLSANINLSPEEQIEHLLRYPYGCLEQTISAAYPWLYATDSQINQLSNYLEEPAGRSEVIENGLSSIAKRQMSSGGYGLWSRDDKAEEHWLTAYAAHFFTDARELGYSIDETLLRTTLERLLQYTRNKASLRERWSEDPGLYRFTYQAYAHYLLARNNIASLADIRAAAEQIPEQATALSLLHLALAAKMQGDKQLADTLYQKSVTAGSGKRPYISDYGSDIRDLAQQARLLWQHDFDSKRASNLTEEVSQLLRHRKYLSTQERIALLQLSREQARHSPDDWRAILTIADKTEAITGETATRITRQGEGLSQGLTLTNTGKGRLYTQLTYQGHSTEPPTEVKSGGVSVERHYWSMKGEQLIPADNRLELRTGDMLLVELVVSSDAYRPDLLLVDLLPAGLEIENQNLGDTSKLEDIRIDGESIMTWQRRYDLRHEEYRDDRYVAALASGSHSGEATATRLFYIARAVTPGTYKVPNPLLEDMYDPEVRAVGSTPAELVVQPL